MVLYASGTALNDVFDFEIDRAERPNRPLPSGRVSRRAAAWLGGLGLAIGPALACTSGSVGKRRSWPRSSLLCILSYDAGAQTHLARPRLHGSLPGLEPAPGNVALARAGRSDRLVRRDRLRSLRRRESPW